MLVHPVWHYYCSLCVCDGWMNRWCQEYFASTNTIITFSYILNGYIFGIWQLLSAVHQKIIHKSTPLTSQKLLTHHASIIHPIDSILSRRLTRIKRIFRRLHVILFVGTLFKWALSGKDHVTYGKEVLAIVVAFFCCISGRCFALCMCQGLWNLLSI